MPSRDLQEPIVAGLLPLGCAQPIEREAKAPFHLHRRRGEEERAGKVVVRQSRHPDRFGSGGLGHAVGEIDRAHRLVAHEVHRAGNRRSQALGFEAFDPMNAGNAAGQLLPIRLDAFAEGRDDAKARDRDDRAAEMVEIAGAHTIRPDVFGAARPFDGRRAKYVRFSKTCEGLIRRSRSRDGRPLRHEDGRSR